MRVILASKSPRRRELLGKLGAEMGFEFDIITRETDEKLDEGISCLQGVEILAVRKGEAVASELPPDCLVISSDTLVELDGEALGKPIDEDDARRMLSHLSGRAHNVHTGVAVHFEGRVYSDVASTAVRFRRIEESELEYYVKSGEPMDKAGAYGIQGYAGRFVESYDGDFDTVIGLSLALTRRLIEKAVKHE